eukprot:682268-Pyramimonas_sp.AAC.1
MGVLRPEILAIHEAQQANYSMQLARHCRNQERQLRRVMNRAGAPAAPTLAGQPAMRLSAAVAMGAMPVRQRLAPAAPPSRHDIGESTLERQT